MVGCWSLVVGGFEVFAVRRLLCALCVVCGSSVVRCLLLFVCNCYVPDGGYVLFVVFFSLVELGVCFVLVVSCVLLVARCSPSVGRCVLFVVCCCVVCCSLFVVGCVLLFVA